MVKINKINKKIEEQVLESAIELARKGEGALFVIADKVSYEKLIKQKLQKFNVLEKGARKLLVSLATIDGAVIINSKGDVVDYGVMIKKARAYPGYGTRHAAAFTASNNNNTCILASEEERKVKIFKNGKFIMQLDALQKNIENEIPKIASLLESVGAGLIGTIGASVLIPTLGIALLPGVIIFGASYFAIKELLSLTRKKKE